MEKHIPQSVTPEPMPQPEPQKSRGRMPHIYVLLFLISGMSALLTYVIPAGSFERIPGPNGRETIDPDSFTQIDGSPLSFMDFMVAIPRGMSDASEIIFLPLSSVACLWCCAEQKSLRLASTGLPANLNIIVC